MIGIIYKLTIKAKYQIDGHKPFYIGQHWCRSVDDFLCRDYPYYGSGKIWNSFLTRLKKDYPSKWRYFIKREVLCTVTNNSQRTLDRLEEFWIKREKSHYSLRLGGCNILWGAAVVGSNPMYDPMVRKKVSEKNKGRKISEETKKKISEIQKGHNNWHFGQHWSEDIKQKIRRSNLGKKRTEETKRNLKKLCGNRNSRFGKNCSEEHKERLRQSNIGKHHKGTIFISNGIIQVRIKSTEPIPDGFRKCMLKTFNKYYRKRYE